MGEMPSTPRTWPVPSADVEAAIRRAAGTGTHVDAAIKKFRIPQHLRGNWNRISPEDRAILDASWRELLKLAGIDPRRPPGVHRIREAMKRRLGLYIDQSTINRLNQTL
jgi:hypothetical protein